MLRSGRVEESIFPIQEALAVCRQLDLGGFLQQALHINAEILANQIPMDEKKIDEMMQEATALVQRSNSRWYRIDHLLTEARINLKIRKPELSRKCISEAKSLYRELGLKNATEELLLVEEELENQKIDNR